MATDPNEHNFNELFDMYTSLMNANENTDLDDDMRQKIKNAALNNANITFNTFGNVSTNISTTTNGKHINTTSTNQGAEELMKIYRQFFNSTQPMANDNANSTDKATHLPPWKLSADQIDQLMDVMKDYNYNESNASITTVHCPLILNHWYLSASVTDEDHIGLYLTLSELPSDRSEITAAFVIRSSSTKTNDSNSFESTNTFTDSQMTHGNAKFIKFKMRDNFETRKQLLMTMQFSAEVRIHSIIGSTGEQLPPYEEEAPPYEEVVEEAVIDEAVPPVMNKDGNDSKQQIDDLNRRLKAMEQKLEQQQQKPSNTGCGCVLL